VFQIDYMMLLENRYFFCTILTNILVPINNEKQILSVNRTS